MTTKFARFDAIIIGAGIAGLAAAETLHAAGGNILLIEARDYVGGRIYTENSWGIPLDLGASWIHGIRRNPITTMANKFGVQTLVSNIGSLSLKRYDTLSLYDWTGKKVSVTEIRRLRHQLEEFELFIRDAQLVTEKDVSCHSMIKKFIQMHRFSEREIKLFRYAVSAAIEYEYAEDASKLSFLEFGKEEPFSGPDVIFLQGYGQIPAQLAKGLPILLNTTVKKIIYDEDGVEIITNTESFRAGTAIIALPLGVLKSETQLFAPILPRWKQQAIRRLQMGLLNKVYLKFEKPFWDIDSEVIGYIPATKLSWIEFINFYKYLQQPIIMAFNAGSRARQMEQWPKEKIIESIMQVFKTIYGEQILQPEDCLVTNWENDPFARGSYSYIPVGVTEEECQKLAEPILNRLFFAGEATNAKMLGTVHGAYLSGIKAAKLVSDLWKKS